MASGQWKAPGQWEACAAQYSPRAEAQAEVCGGGGRGGYRKGDKGGERGEREYSCVKRREVGQRERQGDVERGGREGEKDN